MDTVLKDMNPVLQMLIVMTLFSLIPFVFCCMTSFLRFVIVFSMLKTAMGTQQVPPSIRYYRTGNDINVLYYGFNIPKNV